MTICGIIAEYNPFHLGHAHHLLETRRRLDPDALLVCAMSGNFVQRGDFALLEKYERAAMAVECGADLVVELPLPAALSSGDGFARGGVKLLAALGCSHISFGAECDNLLLLLRAAALVHSSKIEPLFKAARNSGLNYAAALQKAAEALDPEAALLLSEPNNVLGMAYSLQAVAAGITPIPIPRVGAGHNDSAAKDGFASASCLRGLILSAHLRPAVSGSLTDAAGSGVLSENSVSVGSGLPAANGVPSGSGSLSAEPWRAYMPTAAADRLLSALRENRAPVAASRCDTALLSHLRRLDVESLRPYAAGLSGFAERLHLAIQKGCTFEEVCAAAKTRSYTLAHIRRTLLRAYLDLPVTLSLDPQYIRVLALSPGGAEILRRAKLPVITKPASERRLPEALQPALRHDALADSLYALAAPHKSERSAQARWRKTPFVRKA